MKFSSDIVIGLEIHVELNTDTKLFCGCKRSGNDEPNTRTCPTCLGHPGSKPVVNKKAIEYALKLALALNSKIAKEINMLTNALHWFTAMFIIWAALFFLFKD